MQSIAERLDNHLTAKLAPLGFVAASAQWLIVPDPAVVRAIVLNAYRRAQGFLTVLALSSRQAETTPNAALPIKSVQCCLAVSVSFKVSAMRANIS